VSPDGTVARGTDAIRKAIERIAAMRATLTNDIKRVVMLGDDLAAIYNDWTFTGKRPDGSAVQLAGKALEVMRRQHDGTWLILFDDPRARG
jgi:ketosteroid isomerase-like protein